MSSAAAAPPMERVLYNLHSRCCSYALQTTSRRSRFYAEHFLLVLAVGCFGALLIAHRTLVWDPSFATNQHSIPTHCLSSIEGWNGQADVTHLILLERDSEQTSHAVSLLPEDAKDTCHSNGSHNHRWKTGDKASSQQRSTTTIAQPNRHPLGEILVSYARQQGFLYLSSASSHPELLYTTHQVHVQYVYVSPSDARCFGEPFLQRLVFYALGPDTVLINWLLGTFHDGGSQTNHNTTTTATTMQQPGYIYNPRTRVMIPVHEYPEIIIAGDRRSWPTSLLTKGLVIVKTAFLFFVTTTLVAFTLRETQGRMLHFTQSLQYHVRHHLSVTHLVTTHVVENVIFVPIMVGMIFFLIQCYRGDKFLAFMVLSLVWVCESFSVVSLRTEQGIQYFPLFFFQLFAMFHYYHMMFPFGFSYAALTTSMMFMMHSMLFFWHRYELPAVLLGRVSHEHVRETRGASTPPSFVPSDSGSITPEAVEAEGGSLLASAAADFDAPPALVRRNVHAERNHPLNRSHSYSTLASGRNSRNSSNYGMMYHRGDNDDDDDGSYMFFMGGEVVIPRPAGDAPLRTTVPPPANPISRTASATSSVGGVSVDSADLRMDFGRRERYVNELSPVLGRSREDDSELVESIMTPPPPPPGGMVDRLDRPPEAAERYGGGGVDMGALPMILNVMGGGDDEDLTASNHYWEGDDEGVTTNSIFR